MRNAESQKGSQTRAGQKSQKLSFILPERIIGSEILKLISFQLFRATRCKQKEKIVKGFFYPAPASATSLRKHKTHYESVTLLEF